MVYKMRRKLIRVAVVFILIVSLVVLSLLIAGLYTQISDINEAKIKTMAEKAKSCNFELPNERSIILRMDDIGGIDRYEFGKKITDIVLAHDRSIVLGVIPSRLDNKETISWLKSLSGNSNVEIALHGYEHTYYEFNDLNKKDASNKLWFGIKKLYSEIDVFPYTFIPPNNRYSISTLDAVADSGIKIFSAKQNEVLFDSNPVMLGYTKSTYREDGLVSADEVIQYCKKSLDKNNLCIILIHPQDYDLNDQIDPKGYNELVKVLNSFESLNAEPKTFKDLITC